MCHAFHVRPLTPEENEQRRSETVDEMMLFKEKSLRHSQSLSWSN